MNKFLASVPFSDLLTFMISLLTMKRSALLLFCTFFSLFLVSCDEEKSVPGSGWEEYLGGPDRNHYADYDQVNLSNVAQLEVAWEYHTGDSGQVQCNPIIVDGVLYGITASVQPFALDAATGKEIWRVEDTTTMKWYSISRGLTYWEAGEDKRILFTRESWLYALNAATGESIRSFGIDGRVFLGNGLGDNVEDKFVISTTPGTLFEDLIIMPLRISEGTDAARGHIQAFNVRTGELEWVFKTIPEPDTPGSETWPKEAFEDPTIGGANNWAGMAIDLELGIVYVPTGSAAFDFFGGNRKGSNLYANTLLALDAETGEKIWHQQLVHHDILDRDPPAPPNLLTVNHGGKDIDAVAQITKQGYIFLFNRETGEPLFEIEEVPVPASDVPGEEAWPTQPRPVKPSPFARQTLGEDDISPYAKNRDELITILQESRNEGPFTPLSEQGTIIFPGLDGGAEWGGAAVDPEGIMYLNSNEMAWLISLEETGPTDNDLFLTPGGQVYAKNCSACHGAERSGNPESGFPSLVNLNDRLEREHVLKVITSGQGKMPAFKSLSDREEKLLIAYLYADTLEIAEDKKEVETEGGETDDEYGYEISGYTKFLGQDGYPAISPPWGTLNAVNLNTGEYLWTKVYGEYPELSEKGIPQTGAESYGGPVVTAGGLLFIAGTKDAKFRAYNKKTGDLVWEVQLPAAAFATPSVYMIDGKQYVVIACGGTKLGAEKGDSYVAFALP